MSFVTVSVPSPLSVISLSTQFLYSSNLILSFFDGYLTRGLCRLSIKSTGMSGVACKDSGLLKASVKITAQ